MTEFTLFQDSKPIKAILFKFLRISLRSLKKKEPLTMKMQMKVVDRFILEVHSTPIFKRD